MSADLPANLGADRNLLFGVLALQLKFITRDALVAALHAWALDRSRPQVAGDSAPTQAGAVLGTPPYMSPEQAAGRLDEVSPASDVYSLGATLYCLLTDRAPFEGPDVADVLYRVRHGDFPPPRKVNFSVPPGLEAACLKAMALKPAERYGSPRELADEVERWLADEPVRAYPEPWRARLWRWARRHRTLVVGCAALLLTAVAALTVGLVALGRKQRETDRQARAARLLVRRARVLARQGKPAEAAATAERLAGLAGGAAGHLYDAACCCALCVPAVGKGKRAGELTAGERAEREKYAGRALAYLEKARSAGFFQDAGRVQTFAKDPDLDALRGRADFRKFAAGVGAGP